MKTLFSFLCLFFLLACNQSSVEHKEANPGFNEGGFVSHGAKAFYDWTLDRIPLVSAHRGGPYPGLPENAIATFEYIASQTPAIIECDVAITADSVLVLMHDATLDRTTTGTGRVDAQSWSDLQQLRLKDNAGAITEHKIPTLEETLAWASGGKVLFTLDVKRGVPFSKVIEAVREMNMEMYAAIITYNVEAAKTVYELDSSLMISVGISSETAYEAYRSAGIPDENMIAFVGVSEPDPGLYNFLHQKGIYCILGVLGNLDKKVASKNDSLYAGFVKRGADILATDRPLEAAKILKPLVPESSSKRQYFHDY